jgi:hypothetical protein
VGVEDVVGTVVEELEVVVLDVVGTEVVVGVEEVEVDEVDELLVVLVVCSLLVVLVVDGAGEELASVD